MSNLILIGPIVGVFLIAGGFLLGYVVFPPIVTQRITESVQLKRDTEQYDRWKELPQPIDFKVYIFNVTNKDEIQRGLQPRVEEIGPYVYTQYRRKYGIRFSRDNEHVSYYQQLHFEFNAEKSHPFTQNDSIVVLSMHVNSILQAVESETPFLMGMVAPELKTIFGADAASSMFIKTTPGELLFSGIEFCRDPLGVAQIVCMSIEERKLQTITKSEDGRAMKFSLFGHKNKTNDGLYEINTGIRRIDRFQQIEKWNNAKTLKAWKKDPNGAPSGCQFINGTDSTSAGPFRKEGDNFYIFSSDICRSVQLFFEKRVVYDSIPAYRYKIGNNFLNDLDDCFCTDKIKGTLKHEDGCLYNGALDLYDCLEASIVATLPHFFGADEKYARLIDGIYPDESKHVIIMDVEPMTGVPLRGGKKLQLNMFLRRIDQIPITKNFGSPILFPVVWLDEGLELNEEMTGMIKRDLTNVLLILDAVQWTFVGVGAAMVIGMLIWYFIARKKLSKTSSTEVITDGTK